jgi:hypothetical protein
MFRELQEGLTEAENARAAGKRWPSPETLAAQGIPPFASEAVAKPAYRWRLVQDGEYVNYVGVPALGSSAAAFLVFIQEPGPGSVDTMAASTPPDEVYHRLADGTLIHVSIWFRADGSLVPGGGMITRPFVEGWTQILVGSQRP